MFLYRGYCGTATLAGCGFICNIGVTTLGQGTITVACACGGDLNVDGGISCTDFNACAPLTPNLGRYYHSYPAGLRSTSPGHTVVCYCSTGSVHTRGEAAFELAFTGQNGLASASSYHTYTVGQYIDCGCFAYTCQSVGITGAGYGSNMTAGGVTNTQCGSRGGGGQVKITFIG